MVPMRNGNRRQVGNLYYTTIGRTVSLFFTEQFHPLSLPRSSYTSHLPPSAAGRQPPRKPESERNPQSCLDGWTRPQWRRIMFRRSTTGTGSRAEVTMGLALHRTEGSSFWLPLGQDYVPPWRRVYDCLVKM